MPDSKRQALALKAVIVSGRAALRDTAGPERQRVHDRIDELLARLEEMMIRDGGDDEVLAAIRAERRRIRD